jgi:hypothetical protein
MKGRYDMRGFTMFKGVVSLAVCSWLAGAGNVLAQIAVTNNPTQDAFVRSMNSTNNYGAAGALSVSGSTATNSTGSPGGLLDSFLQFNVSSDITNFNGTFGVGQWAISSVTLGVTAQSPNNVVFNYGVGQFAVNWLGNNSWQEGTGTPSSPTTNGITYAQESSLLNSNVDEALGAFTYGGATSGRMNMSLGLTPGFVSEISTGSLISLFMTAISNSVGFTFNSENFMTASSRPSLIITAVAVPEPSTMVLLGTSYMILAAMARRRRKNKHASAD